MEILIILIVIMALLLIMGVELTTILFGVMQLMIILLLLTVLFFVRCTFILMKTEKSKATLTKVENHPKFKYPSPYYEVDGIEYPNIFPCEVVMRNRLYPEGKQCNVRLHRRRNLVFDTNAMACTILGVALGSVSLLMVGFMTYYLFR